MTDIGVLEGVGKMTRQRMINRGLGTVELFNEYIHNHNNTELRQLINEVSLNPRGNQCLEGYHPRIHNKRIVDGLVSYVKTQRINFVHPDYKKSRVPPSKVNNPYIQCGNPAQKWGNYYWGHTTGVHHIGQYIPYETNDPTRATSTPSTGTLHREGIAYRSVPKTGFKSGKSCIPNKSLSTTQRNHLIRTNAIYQNRRHYNCDCFRSEKTCNDFAPQRGNRLLRTYTKVGLPTKPYCKWIQERHQCVNI